MFFLAFCFFERIKLGDSFSNRAQASQGFLDQSEHALLTELFCRALPSFLFIVRFGTEPMFVL